MQLFRKYAIDTRQPDPSHPIDYLKVEGAFESTRDELHQFLKKAPEGWFALDDYAPSHGFVWLYLRKPSELETADK